MMRIFVPVLVVACGNYQGSQNLKHSNEKVSANPLTQLAIDDFCGNKQVNINGRVREILITVKEGDRDRIVNFLTHFNALGCPMTVTDAIFACYNVELQEKVQSNIPAYELTWKAIFRCICEGYLDSLNLEDELFSNREEQGSIGRAHHATLTSIVDNIFERDSWDQIRTLLQCLRSYIDSCRNCGDENNFADVFNFTVLINLLDQHVRGFKETVVRDLCFFMIALNALHEECITANTAFANTVRNLISDLTMSNMGQLVGPPTSRQ